MLKDLLITNRLLIESLSIRDNTFIYELVNTKEWLQFIGNRNVNSEIEAAAYIQKILNTHDTHYFVARIKETRVPVGIITFIKRSYLEHFDIGFAFLPQFTNRGYAYEATKVVLDGLIQSGEYSQILSITIPGNSNAIRLINKLGLQFLNKIEVENEFMNLYSFGR